MASCEALLTADLKIQHRLRRRLSKASRHKTWTLGFFSNEIRDIELFWFKRSTRFPGDEVSRLCGSTDPCPEARRRCSTSSRPFSRRSSASAPGLTLWQRCTRTAIAVGCALPAHPMSACSGASDGRIRVQRSRAPGAPFRIHKPPRSHQAPRGSTVGCGVGEWRSALLYAIVIHRLKVS